MRDRFSCTEETKRQSLIIITASLFNACNVALYSESGNEFADHYGLIDRRLTHSILENPWQFAPLVGILFFSGLLAYSNHIHYVDDYLSDYFPRPKSDDFFAAMPIIRPEKVMKKRWKHAAKIDVVSAGYKAVIASLSLAALLKNRVHSDAFAIIAGAICVFGNFAAQYAIFSNKKEDGYRFPLSPRKRWWAKHALTFFYNLPNVVLYFNQGDAFLEHIGFLDHRLSDFEGAGETLGFVLLLVGSVSLFISTQRSYAEKVEKFFKDPDEVDVESGFLVTAYNQSMTFFEAESWVTSVYKAVINYISLVANLFNFRMNIYAAFAVTSLSIVANVYAQRSVLKPKKSVQQRRNEQVEPTEYRSSWSGLFARTSVRETTGFQSLPQTILSL